MPKFQYDRIPIATEQGSHNNMYVPAVEGSEKINTCVSYTVITICP